MKRARILVVEDNEQVRTAMLEILGDAGYHACGAVDAGEALRKQRSCRHALVLVDVHLEGADALVRTLGNRGTAVVHVTTGGAKPPPGLALVKPFDARALVEVVRRALA